MDVARLCRHIAQVMEPNPAWVQQNTVMLEGNARQATERRNPMTNVRHGEDAPLVRLG